MTLKWLRSFWRVIRCISDFQKPCASKNRQVLRVKDTSRSPCYPVLCRHCLPPCQVERQAPGLLVYLDLKHVHKYGSTKFQPNPLFPSKQMATEHTESAAEEIKQTKQNPKKSANHRGSRRDGILSQHSWLLTEGRETFWMS